MRFDENWIYLESTWLPGASPEPRSKALDEEKVDEERRLIFLRVAARLFEERNDALHVERAGRNISSSSTWKSICPRSVVVTMFV